MIVDVHTHAPYHREAPPPAAQTTDTLMRPDKPVATSATWADYAEAMTAVDRAIRLRTGAHLPEAAMVRSAG